MLLHTGLVILAYLAGSLASAVIVCKIMGLEDPREQGSGNPGTTNVLRLHGRTAALLTLCGDVLKGALPVLLLRYVQAPDVFVAAAGLAAFSGHLYPLFFGFRGGKGVATLLGVLLAFHWLLGAAFIMTWLLVALLSRYSSLAAITAALLAPVYCWLMLPSPYLVAGTGLMSAILIWRHRSNIKNLLAGKENKISL
ncbi:MAG: glycerol-3-phosphate 1-O-acyltransferase PlsY [Gammaproteobacteria bacterium]|nr:glycerol-3-phosphate 1-O-acyltransferase PlsY [Gammaproteobacteria bacterium]